MTFPVYVLPKTSRTYFTVCLKLNVFELGNKSNPKALGSPQAGLTRSARLAPMCWHLAPRQGPLTNDTRLQAADPALRFTRLSNFLTISRCSNTFKLLVPCWHPPITATVAPTRCSNTFKLLVPCWHPPITATVAPTRQDSQLREAVRTFCKGNGQGTNKHILVSALVLGNTVRSFLRANLTDSRDTSKLHSTLASRSTQHWRAEDRCMLLFFLSAKRAVCFH